MSKNELKSNFTCCVGQMVKNDDEKKIFFQIFPMSLTKLEHFYFLEKKILECEFSVYSNFSCYVSEMVKNYDSNF